MGTAKEKGLRVVFSESNRNTREQEAAPDLQPEMQQAHNVFEAKTKATIRAIASGQRPEFKPQVNYKIPEDNARDVLSIADAEYDPDSTRSYKFSAYGLPEAPSSSSSSDPRKPMPHGLNDMLGSLRVRMMLGQS